MSGKDEKWIMSVCARLIPSRVNSSITLLLISKAKISLFFSLFVTAKFFCTSWGHLFEAKFNALSWLNKLDTFPPVSLICSKIMENFTSVSLTWSFNASWTRWCFEASKKHQQRLDFLWQQRAFLVSRNVLYLFVLQNQHRKRVAFWNCVLKSWLDGQRARRERSTLLWMKSCSESLSFRDLFKQDW